MALFYAETGCGCCIRSFKTLDDAEDGILREVGTREGVTLVREATERDIEHVRSMGGYVPLDHYQ
jgi:hypothetical protein